jgi:hypothetical protein
MTQNKARRTNKIDFLQLPWAQEVWSSNLHAPTKSFSIRKLQKPDFDTAALWCNLGTMVKIPEAKQCANFD